MAKKSKDSTTLTQSILQADWYLAMLDDCQATITESVFVSRWALVEGYHIFGKRILEENDNFKRAGIYGSKIVETVAKSLHKSPRTVWRAIQFVKKYPRLDRVPEGKNISWNKLVNKYLPERTGQAPSLPEGKFKSLKSLDKNGRVIGVCEVTLSEGERVAKELKPKIIVWINREGGGDRRAVMVYAQDLIELIQKETGGA